MPINRALSSGRPRRVPWPHDLDLSGIDGISGTTGFMLLAPKKGGKLYSSEVTEAPPEQEMVWRDWSGGMGKRIQGGPGENMYSHAYGVDASIQGQLMPGPLITTITPDASVDSTNGISHFYEVGGNLWALNGRYAHLRTADTAAGWGSGSTVQDFGGGKVATDVIVYRVNGGSTTYAYIAMGDSELMYRQTAPSTFTQHGSLYARAFCLASKDLWRSPGVNQLAKVDKNADPWTAGNWSSDNAYYIGSAESSITRLVLTASGGLTIFKTDGVYVLNDQGADVQLYSDLKLAPDSTNGRYTWKHENWIHTTLNGRHVRLGPDLFWEPIGPERFAQNDSPVHGYITAGVSTPFGAYAGIYSPDSQKSYLLKWGAWAMNGNQAQRIDAWHGSISQSFDSKIITAMYRTSIGAPSRHERLYMGFSDGTLAYFTLPCTTNPYACSSYATPNTSGNYLFLPGWHGGLPQAEKHFRLFTVTAQGISSAPSIDIGTAAIGDTTTSTFTEVSFTNAPGGQAEVATDTEYAMADIRIELKGSGNTPFRMLGLALRYAVQTPVALKYRFSVLAENGLVKRNKVRFSIGADRIRQILRAAWNTKGSITATFDDETTDEVTITNYSESTMVDQVTRQYRAVIDIEAIQAKRLTSNTGASTGSLT